MICIIRGKTFRAQEFFSAWAEQRIMTDSDAILTIWDRMPKDGLPEEYDIIIYETEERLQNDGTFERKGWSVKTLIAHLEKPDWRVQCIPYALHWADANPRRTHHG